MLDPQGDFWFEHYCFSNYCSYSHRTRRYSEKAIKEKVYLKLH